MKYIVKHYRSYLFEVEAPNETQAQLQGRPAYRKVRQAGVEEDHLYTDGSYILNGDAQPVKKDNWLVRLIRAVAGNLASKPEPKYSKFKRFKE